MANKNDEAAKRIHKAYLQCKETFAPNRLIENIKVDINDEEEDLFFKVVSDFFLQLKQKEIISR